MLAANIFVNSTVSRKRGLTSAGPSIKDTLLTSRIACFGASSSSFDVECSMLDVWTMRIRFSPSCLARSWLMSFSFHAPLDPLVLHVSGCPTGSGADMALSAALRVSSEITSHLASYLCPAVDGTSPPVGTACRAPTRGRTKSATDLGSGAANLFLSEPSASKADKKSRKTGLSTKSPRCMSPFPQWNTWMGVHTIRSHANSIKQIDSQHLLFHAENDRRKWMDHFLLFAFLRLCGKIPLRRLNSDFSPIPRWTRDFVSLRQPERNPG